MKFKIALLIALAVLLQASLRILWPPLVYIDLPLIAVVYFALQRDMVQAVIIGTIAGLSTDALSGGILGAGGHSMRREACRRTASAMRRAILNFINQATGGKRQI